MMTGAYRFPAMESVIYGRPFTEALKEEVERADAHAVFVLASGTLERETDLVERLKSALGNRFAGLNYAVANVQDGGYVVGHRCPVDIFLCV